jgi:hypothetical protein
MTDNKFNFLIANRFFKQGEVIQNLGNTPCDEKDPHRIQVDKTTFILPKQPIIHSCNPNAYIDWLSLHLIASRTINFGELISYHYGTSEDDYTIGSFNCKCGYKKCLKYFRGFKYMDNVQKNNIKQLISPYLAKKYHLL